MTRSLVCSARPLAVLLLCAAANASADTAVVHAGKPLAMRKNSYEMRAGEAVEVSAEPETLNFLLSSKTRSVQLDGSAGTLVAGPNRAHTAMVLAAPFRTSPGTYTAKISATSASGEQRTVSVTVNVKPRQTVPSGASRNPVVLLNGWETGFTGECNVSTSSSDTFGNLAQYLVSDGVPIVYFFDNCVEDANDTVEGIATYLASYLNSIKYADGTQVPQIDLVAFSLGGLIARAYLAGLQTDESLAPPSPTLVGKLILIAAPNFGSFVAANYIYSLAEGTQSAELIPASSFLWNLATWNQRGDDLRGVDALAIVGNAGYYEPSLSSSTELTYASDGLVTLTSAALGFALPDATPTQVVPYCHIDPADFTNTVLGSFLCDAPGIANVTSSTQLTGEIVRSFLAGSTDWKSIGTAAADNGDLSTDGGIYFGMQNKSGAYVKDLTGVTWGSTVALTGGGDTDTIYYTDFVSGTGNYSATSTSLGTLSCGTLALPAGYFSAVRCKISTAIFSVGPLVSGAGRIVSSGGTITITGNTFGSKCTSCQVLAIPAGSGTQTALSVSSWTNTQITATLPSSLTGLLTIEVIAAPGTDAITIMAAVPGPAIATSASSLTFAYTAGGTIPASQSVQITNGGGGTLSWTATASDSWLAVSPTSGTASSTLAVSVAPTGLAAGTYNGTIQIAASGASNTPVSIAVTLTVTAAGASLAVSPSSLSFSYSAGGSAPAAQSVTISMTGTSSASWTASSSVFWATVSPPSSTGPGTLSVTVNPANLAAGSYTGNVQITAAGLAGSPASVAITLVVQGTQAAGTITGVANGASFATNFASATWVSIFGTNLSASTLVWGSSDFQNGALPTSLDGVSVTINGIPAYVEYISPTQINVLAPDDQTTGQVQVQVTAAGQKSNSFAVAKQQYSPAFFTFGNGRYVAALHSNYSYLGAPGLIAGATTTPAQPGEVVLLYGTGFGPTDPATPTGQLVTTAEPLPANAVQITIGGAAATVEFAGLTESGLYQFNVTVPTGLASGDQPVAATIGGVQSQSGLSITVQ